MSKINKAKDVIHEATTLLERYRYQFNMMQAILYRIYKKHGNIEIEVGEFSQDEMNAINFAVDTQTNGETIVSAQLAGWDISETVAQSLERRYQELMK